LILVEDKTSTMLQRVLLMNSVKTSTMLQRVLLMNSVKTSTMLQHGELDETLEKQPASACFKK